uniref:DUF5658 domain-containing protein n=1 Tax=Heterorhabditis bacteriophora TaxID=37862 RepID=A0A1I7WQ80_HETBA
MKWQMSSCVSNIVIGTARTAIAILLIFLTKVSIVLQIIFMLAVHRLRGWHSNFAFMLLYIMSLLSILCYVGMLFGYLQSVFMIDFNILQRVLTPLFVLE